MTREQIKLLLHNHFSEIYKDFDTPLFILPFHGELGHLIGSYIHFIYSLEHKKKVIACKMGQECLFPGCDYFYDWEEIELPNKTIEGDMTKSRSFEYYYLKKVVSLEEGIKKRYKVYKDYNFMLPFIDFERFHSLDPLPTFIPELRRPETYPIDIAIVPRYRLRGPHRNYDKWYEIVEKLHESGYKIGSIGVKEYSFSDLDVEYKSWEYCISDRDIEPAINFIRSAKLTIATTTGIGFLSVFLNKPTLIIKLSSASDYDIYNGKTGNSFLKILTDTSPDSVISEAKNIMERIHVPL